MVFKSSKRLTASVQDGPPPTRRHFSAPSDEAEYLYEKLLYWLYRRGDQQRARGFASRLRRVLGRIRGAAASTRGRECLALIAEANDDLRGAVRHRQAEVLRLRQQLESGEPGSEPLLGAIEKYLYNFSDLADRYDLLAIAFKRAGRLAEAIDALKTSKHICESKGLVFDGADLLSEFEADAATQRGRKS